MILPVWARIEWELPLLAGCGKEGLWERVRPLAGLETPAASCSTEPACSASSESSAMVHMLPLLLPISWGGLLHTSTSASRPFAKYSQHTLQGSRPVRQTCQALLLLPSNVCNAGQLAVLLHLSCLGAKKPQSRDDYAPSFIASLDWLDPTIMAPHVFIVAAGFACSDVVCIGGL